MITLINSRKDFALVTLDKETTNRIITDLQDTKVTRALTIIQNNFVSSSNSKRWVCQDYTELTKDVVDPRSQKRRAKTNQ